MRLGAISGIVAIFALCLLAYDFELWPITLLFFVLNSLACGLLGETALYYHIDNWSKEQPVRTLAEIALTTSALRSMEKFNYLLLARGIVVPIIFGIALFIRGDFDESVKVQVAKAIQLGQLRDMVQEYYTKNGGPPDTFETLGFEFVPNSEIKSLRLYGTTVEVSFELNAVKEKKVLLSMQALPNGSIGWKCKNVDLPLRYLPTACEY